MIKTIKLGKKEIRLSNNIGWTMTYRDQFNKDIVPTLMPMIAGIIDVISGFLKETGKTSDIEVADILNVVDGDSFLDAMIHMAGFDFVDMINIIWSMAKEADDSIPEPHEWIRQFDNFPLDDILPKACELVIKGVVSSKNLKRLTEMMAKIKAKAPQPEKESTSTQLFLQA